MKGAPKSIHAMLQLMLISGTIEVTLRIGNQSISTDRPNLEAADVNPVPGSAWRGVCAAECPVVFCTFALNEDVVHDQVQIWKRRHERLSYLGDGDPIGCRHTLVNGKRAVRCEKGSHARGVLTAPRSRVAQREFSQGSRFGDHSIGVSLSYSGILHDRG
jgi:hypothetical protein